MTRGTAVAIGRPAAGVGHGFATFAAFVIVGAIPLLAFVIGVRGATRFPASVVLGLAALAVVGAARAKFVARPAWRCALEMIVLAGGASGAAYAVGAVLEPLLG